MISMCLYNRGKHTYSYYNGGVCDDCHDRLPSRRPIEEDEPSVVCTPKRKTTRTSADVADENRHLAEMRAYFDKAAEDDLYTLNE